MGERWMIIDGYSNYSISNTGKVFSHRKQKLLNPYICNSGYQQVKLVNDDNKTKHCYIHRLVAIAFIPNPDNLPEVNHINENKTDNNASNLEWCDRQYNATYGSAIPRRVKAFNGFKHSEETKRLMSKQRSDPSTEWHQKMVEHGKQIGKLPRTKEWNAAVSKSKMKPICQLDNDGNIIAEYGSLSEAAIAVGTKPGNISAVLHRYQYRQTAAGFRWCYKSDMIGGVT